MRKTLQVILFILSGLLFIAGIVLVVREYVLIPGAYVEPEITITPAPTLAPTLAPSATIEQTPMPTLNIVTPSPKAELTAPVKIYFPDKKIMMEVQPVGKIEEGKKKGQMGTIDSATIAAWYEPGPIPGEIGNAIINGHVRYGGVKGYFSVLPELELREKVIVEHEDGTYTVFRVRSVDVYPYNKVPDTVMELINEEAILTLITCHGEFQQDVGTSEERCVVICELDS